MSVELRPLGVKCNIQCQYCYQNPIRDAGNVLHAYNMELMKQRVLEEGGPFTLFGGEPLLIPKRDLDDLWSWGLQQFGSNGIQTNGVLIDEEHIELFHKYQVGVGISIDGPGALNDVRWHGTLEKTRESTEKTHAAIKRLCELGRPPSLIVTLHRNNATADKLPLMYEWFRGLARMGINNARLHVLEVENTDIRKKYQLSTEENLRAFRGFANLEKEVTTLRFDIFGDMRNMLSGADNNVTCIWAGCDPYTTRAVRGVEGNGQSSNCGRTNKDGIDFVKSDRPGYERYVALYHTPQEHDGCQGCRFFLMCKGQCPGTSIDHDWRNRTSDCRTWMTLFEDLERELLEQGKTPISVDADRVKIEKYIIDGWKAGENIYMNQAIPAVKRGEGYKRGLAGYGDHSGGHGDAHGDHTDDGTGRVPEEPKQTAVAHGDAHAPHGDRPHGDHDDVSGHVRNEPKHSGAQVVHGDRPHGDGSHGDRHRVEHGDHTDASYRGAEQYSAQSRGSHGDAHGDSMNHGDRHPLVQHGDAHGDHTDVASHGDSNHGDAHGDKHNSEMDCGPDPQHLERLKELKESGVAFEPLSFYGWALSTGVAVAIDSVANTAQAKMAEVHTALSPSHVGFADHGDIPHFGVPSGVPHAQTR